MINQSSTLCNRMAELNDFVESLEKELTCSICDEIFTDPKQLDCLHSFCLMCVVEWNETCKTKRQRLSCPVCRSREDGDIAKLRSSFYLDSLKQLLLAMRSRASKPEDKRKLPQCNSCQEHVILVAFCPQCEGMICSECVNAHKKMKQLRDQHHVVMLNDFKKEHVKSYIANQLHCEEKYHEKHKLEYFCQECAKCICQKCSITSHGVHDKVSMEEKADEVKLLLDKEIHRVKQQKEKFLEELQLSKQHIFRVENEISAAKKTVSDHIQAQMKILKDHEIAISSTLDEMFHEQQIVNNEEQSEIKTVVDQLDVVIDQFTSLQDRNVEFFILQSQLPQRCEELLKIPSVLASKPSKERYTSICYLPNIQVTQSLQNLGKIQKSVADPNHCSIEFSSDVIRCGFINHFEIVTRNYRGEICHISKDCIDVHIQDADGVEVEKKLVASDNGYAVTYKPEKSSPHLLLVNIRGKAVRYSPMKMNTFNRSSILKPIEIFGELGNGTKQLRKELKHPRSIAVNNSSGIVAILDYGNSRVIIFTADGTYLRQFGKEGTGNGALCDAVGIITFDNKVFVTDNPNSGCGRLQVFGVNGEYLRTIYKQKKGRLLRMCLADENIAVCWRHPDENKAKYGIKIFDKQNEHFVREVPITNARPWSIAYANNRYFISFALEPYIGVCDENGVLLYKFGCKGALSGQFNLCVGLDVYDSNTLLVCDNGNNRVQVFTQEGQFIKCFKGFEDGAGPVDIAVTPEGVVYVLERRVFLLIFLACASS